MLDQGTRANKAINQTAESKREEERLTEYRFVIQHFSSDQSQGFENHFFESSPGLLAATLVHYCPSKCLELEPTAMTKPID